MSVLVAEMTAMEGAVSCAIASAIAIEVLAELEGATTSEIMQGARVRDDACRSERRGAV